jgi:hypothetical protein
MLSCEGCTLITNGSKYFDQLILPAASMIRIKKAMPAASMIRIKKAIANIMIFQAGFKFAIGEKRKSLMNSKEEKAL